MNKEQKQGYYVSFFFENENKDMGIGSYTLSSNKEVVTNKDIDEMREFIMRDGNYADITIINLTKLVIENDEEDEGEWFEYTGKANYGLMCTNGEFKPLDEVIKEHPKLSEGFEYDEEWSSLLKRELNALKELQEVTQKMYELDVKAGEEIAEQIANGTF